MGAWHWHQRRARLRSAAYRVRVRPGRTLYFADWHSACEFCAMAGLRIKIIEIGGGL